MDKSLIRWSSTDIRLGLCSMKISKHLTFRVTRAEDRCVMVDNGPGACINVLQTQRSWKWLKLEEYGWQRMLWGVSNVFCFTYNFLHVSEKLLSNNQLFQTNSIEHCTRCNICVWPILTFYLSFSLRLAECLFPSQLQIAAINNPPGG